MAIKEKPLARLCRLVVSWADHLSILLALCGLLGLLVLPQMDRRAKFDEKALMVGGAMATFDHLVSLPVGMRLATAAHAHHHDASPNTTLAQLVAQHMEAVGLQVHMTQMCTPHASRGLPSTHECVHVHGTRRASQTDGTESLLLVTPMALTPGDVEGHAAYWDAPAQGSVLLLAGIQALMHHLGRVQWLSRDVVWVVPDARCGATASLQHWADVNLGEAPPAHTGAHGRPWHVGQGGSGLPQQALVLQADSINVNAAKVLVEGFDGQLPKLDTYLVLKQLLYVIPGLEMQPPDTSKVISSLAAALKSWVQYPDFMTHLHKLSTMTAFMWRQAMGLPTGPHAALKAYMVDTATTHFYRVDGQSRQVPTPSSPRPGTSLPTLPVELEVKAVSIARYAELVLRSFNNLDERFHHSFFLYLLTDIQRFVPVEMYIVPLVLLIVILVLKAAKQVHMLQPLVMTPPTQTVESSTSSTGQPDGSTTVTDSSPVFDLSPDPWLQAIAIGLLCMLASVVLGMSWRALMCPACLTCQYPHGEVCCTSDHGGKRTEALEGVCKGGKGACSMHITTQGPALVRALQGVLPSALQEHVARLNITEGLVLGVSLLVLAGTLGWQSMLLVYQPVRIDAAPTHTKPNQTVEGPRGGTQGSAAKIRWAWLRFLCKVRVVVLTSSAVMLTGMASVNWALAYYVTALLAVVLITSPSLPKSALHGLPPQSKHAWAMAHVMAVTMTSPAVLLGLVGVSTSGSHVDKRLLMEAVPASWAGAKQALLSLLDLTCCSWMNTYLFVWVAYVPCWVLEVVWCLSRF